MQYKHGQYYISTYQGQTQIVAFACKAGYAAHPLDYLNDDLWFEFGDTEQQACQALESYLDKLEDIAA